MQTEKDNIKTIKKALYKRAVGFTATETCEDYVSVEGNMELVKRKVTKKRVPPDVSAIRTLAELSDSGDSCDICDYTDEQLAAEKQRLLKVLRQVIEKGTENDKNT